MPGKHHLRGFKIAKKIGSPLRGSWTMLRIVVGSNPPPPLGKKLDPPLHTYIYTYIHTYIHIHACVHTYTYIHTCTCTYIHTYMYILTYVRTNNHAHIHTCIHWYIYTCTNIYDGMSSEKKGRKSFVGKQCFLKISVFLNESLREVVFA